MYVLTDYLKYKFRSKQEFKIIFRAWFSQPCQSLTMWSFESIEVWNFSSDSRAFSQKKWIEFNRLFGQKCHKQHSGKLNKHDIQYYAIFLCQCWECNFRRSCHSHSDCRKVKGIWVACTQHIDLNCTSSWPKFQQSKYPKWWWK